MIILDYETRSKADLPTVGAYKYATHPTTDILCLALYDEDTYEHIVLDPCDTTLPDIWRKRLETVGYVCAVNAEFDLQIHEHVGVPVYGLPEIPLDRWCCGCSVFRVNGLPANLEDAARAAKSPIKKNPRGKELIKLLCIPQEDGEFLESAGLMLEMMQYCLDDVLATAAVLKLCRRLTAEEHADWLICAEMNRRGVGVDVKLAKLATQYAAAEQVDIADAIARVTGGAITSATQHQRIKKYVLDAIEGSTDENDNKLRRLMTVHKKGAAKISLDKDVRASIITAIEEAGLNIYEDLEQLIRLLDAASASSVAKFRKMVDLAGPDNRVRGAFIHAGASQTHRFSSKGLQLHNMRRDALSADETLELMGRMQRAEVIPNVMQTLAKLLRPALVPRKGYVYVVGDWSSIEARGLPWLTDDPRADRKLDLFREGMDVYVEAAKGIYGKVDITPAERQVGKVSELSLGYGGAAGAFSAMARNYGVTLPDYQVQRIVKNWRAANGWAVEYWAALEKAAKNAIRSRGDRSFSAGRVTYHYVPALLGGTLICELPDGTFIHYPFARIEYSNTGDNIVALKASIKPKADDKKNHWGIVRLWGGMMAENITQALCAGVLRYTLRNLGGLLRYLVAHVHDEIILEVPESKAEKYKVELKAIMETTPSFAAGLPLKAEPVILTRYGKH